MRKQDFIQSKLEETKFRVYSPGELVTTQEEVDDYAIGFGEWLAKWSNVGLENGNWIINFRLKASTTKEALEIFKKEKGL